MRQGVMGQAKLVQQGALVRLAPARQAGQQPGPADRAEADAPGHVGQPTPGRQRIGVVDGRSEEHTSELQSLMRISYAVFCLKKKKITHAKNRTDDDNRL